MRATFAGQCPACRTHIEVGETIVRRPVETKANKVLWAHEDCTKVAIAREVAADDYNAVAYQEHAAQAAYKAAERAALDSDPSGALLYWSYVSKGQADSDGYFGPIAAQAFMAYAREDQLRLAEVRNIPAEIANAEAALRWEHENPATMDYMGDWLRSGTRVAALTRRVELLRQLSA